MGVKLTTGGKGLGSMKRGLSLISSSEVLVGIPEGDNRAADLLAEAGKMQDRAANMKLTKSGKATKRATALATAAEVLRKKALSEDVSNAELLFIFSKGSPRRGQPARPVIEPAIAQPDMAKMIAKQLAAAATAAMDGNMAVVVDKLNKAGILGENASKRWFTDSRNNWPPNSPLTIALKGSDRPGIDTGAMRRAITHVLIMGQVRNVPDDTQDRDAMGPTNPAPRASDAYDWADDTEIMEPEEGATLADAGELAVIL